VGVVKTGDEQALNVLKEQDNFFLATAIRDQGDDPSWILNSNYSKLLHPPHRGCE
jgi:hypothetical protein